MCLFRVMHIGVVRVCERLERQQYRHGTSIDAHRYLTHLIATPTYHRSHQSLSTSSCSDSDNASRMLGGPFCHSAFAVCSPLARHQFTSIALLIAIYLAGSSAFSPALPQHWRSILPSVTDGSRMLSRPMVPHRPSQSELIMLALARNSP